jgi:hypothetical protein
MALASCRRRYIYINLGRYLRHPSFASGFSDQKDGPRKKEGKNGGKAIRNIKKEKTREPRTLSRLFY